MTATTKTARERIIKFFSFTMSLFKIQAKRLSFQQVGNTVRHCCVPLCTCSSKYNKIVSFHSFPVDAAVRAEWKQKIRRDDFMPTKHTRVCSRHFKKTDIDVTVSGRRRVKKGAIPVLFSWNGYQLPAPRPSVWERRPQAVTYFKNTSCISLT